MPDDGVIEEEFLTCQFARYTACGEPIFECERADYTVVAMGPDEYVRVCPVHRSWTAALGPRW